MFVASITTLIILLNNENLNGEMQANVVHGEEDHAHREETLDYESFAPQTSGPAIIVGMDGLIDYVNEEYKKETRYIESEIQDQLFFSYIHPQDLAEILAAYGQVLSSQKPDVLVGPFRMKNAAGEYLLQMAAMQPIFQDDHMVGVTIETEDISDKLQVGSSTTEYEIEELDEGTNVESESGSLDQDAEFKYRNFESEYLPPLETENEQMQGNEQITDEQPDTNDTADENNNEDLGIHYGQLKNELNGEEDIDDVKADVRNKESRNPQNEEMRQDEGEETTKQDKKIRDKTNDDKKLVVDNLARVVNKVYRDPDVLVLLF